MNTSTLNQSSILRRLTRQAGIVTRFCAVLLCMLCFVGAAWGYDVEFSEFSSQTKANYFKSYSAEDGSTVTLSTPLSISSSSGDYFVNLSSTASNAGSNYIEVYSNGSAIESIEILITGNGQNKTLQPAFLGWTGNAENASADEVQLPTSTTVSNKGYSNAQWVAVSFSGDDIQRVRFYRAVKGVAVGTYATTATIGNAQTVQFYGIRVTLRATTKTIYLDCSIMHNWADGASLWISNADSSANWNMSKVGGCNDYLYKAEVDPSVSHLVFKRGTVSNHNAWHTYDVADMGSNNLLTFTGYAQGELGTYKPYYPVHFDANGHGDDPDDQCVKSGETASTPTAPTASGWAFGGWYTESACTNQWNFGTAITAEKTLYAKWEESTTRRIYLHTLFFGNSDGAKFAVYYFKSSDGTNGWSDIMTQPEDCDGNVYTTTIPEEYDKCIFVRLKNTATEGSWDNTWNQTVNLDIPADKDYFQITTGGTGDTYTGSWKTYQPSYPVHFNANGHGSDPSDQCIYSGNTASAPTAPTATGWTFEGWYTEAACTNAWNFSTTITAEKTLYAKWTEDLSSAWTLKGDFVDDWATTYYFTKNAGESTGSVAYCTVSITDASHDYEFKVINGDWYGCGSTMTENNCTNWNFQSDWGNCKITPTEAGDYIFKIDYSGTNPKVSVIYPDPTPVIVYEGSDLACSTPIVLEVKGNGTAAYTSGTFQWYKDGVAISGATNSTCSVTEAGTYTVQVTLRQTLTSSNSAVITKTVVSVEKLTPFHCYRLNCDYTKGTDNRYRHLFAYTNAAPDGQTPYALTAVVKKADSSADVTLTTGISSWISDKTGTSKDTIMLDMKGLTDANTANSYGLAVGDVITLTATPRNSCGSLDNSGAKSIDITVIRQDRRLLAFIVSGCDSITLRLGGDCFTDYNPYELKYETDKNKWNNNPLPLYASLQDDYITVPCNGYGVFNIFNYEPFDIILLTDFPQTEKTKKYGDETRNSSTYINDLANLVDYKPMLTLKAHMAKSTLPKWKEKGFTANPYTPIKGNPQIAMNVLCYSHDMFDELSPKPTEANPSVQITSEPGYEDNKALQGFERDALYGFLEIATICDTVGKNESRISGGDNIKKQLIACCERQTVTEARLVVLSINAHATSLINNNGISAIKVLLKYLLYDNPALVADCGVTFDNGGSEARDGSGDGLWSTAANWTPVPPYKNANVRIKANCTVDVQTVAVGKVALFGDNTITINPAATLTASSKLGTTPDEAHKNHLQSITDPSKLVIKADASHSGSLIQGDKAGETFATVQIYSKANIPAGATKIDDWNWQYIAVPFSDETDANRSYMFAYFYKWNKADNNWLVVPDRDQVNPWLGYCVTQSAPHTYIGWGNLVGTGDQTLPLTAGLNMLGNSWTAPIDISKFENSDFNNLSENTFFFFNTGNDPEQDATRVSDSNNDTPGNYISVTKTFAGKDGLPGVIPSMQGFFVDANAGGGSLKLRYDSLVRANHFTAEANKPMRVISKVAQTSDEAFLSIKVSSEHGSDKVRILENASYSTAFESGVDASKLLNASTDVPQIYGICDYGDLSLVGIPDFEGTILGFRPGCDDTYTITIHVEDYDDDLYLYDTEAKVYTYIADSATYSFSKIGSTASHRFMLTRQNAGATPTDITNVYYNDNGMTISNPLCEKLTLYIYDAAGRLCSVSTNASPIVDITLPMQAGVYTVQIVGETTNIVRKMAR